MEQELRHSNEELRQFSSIASHDLKSPLAVAQGFMLLLKRQLGDDLPPEQRARIFGMFERLHGSDTYRGTGVGLAICEKAVRRHGGTIWVDERGDGGSRFCFTLPERDPAP